MMQIIKFTDNNPDGYMENYVQVEGKNKLTSKTIKKMNEVIKKHKESEEEVDTDSVIDIAVKFLETEGYMCYPIIAEHEIEF